jgi:YVTN family beta-propeller protein
VIDTATLNVIATIPVGASPHSIAVHPNRPLAANVNYDANSVTEIDTSTLRVVTTIPVGKNPRDMYGRQMDGLLTLSTRAATTSR